MKVKKRLFAGMLALAMLLSLNVTAFASAPSDGSTVSVSEEPVKSVTLTKTYKVANQGTTAPNATFRYIITPGTVEDGPEGVATSPEITGTYTTEFPNGTDSTDGITEEFTFDLPVFPGVGIYNYTISENASGLAGVVDDTNDVTMKVTVVNNDDYTGYEYYVALYKDTTDDGQDNPVKIVNTAAFTNVYEANSMTVDKTVRGDFGVKDEYFEFTVALTGEPEKTYADSYNITGQMRDDSDKSISVGSTATVYLKHGDEITISNLPYGVTYTVTEIDGGTENEAGENGYMTKAENAKGTIGENVQKVHFTNTKGGTIDTGVYLDNLPYIIVFAGVLAAVAVLVIRRRRVDD